MRNKKLIALVCALSMLFSLFASFTVVNAEGEAKAGIVLTKKTISTTVTEITVEYGEDFYAEGIAAAQINLNLPTDAKVDFTEAITEKGFVYAGGDFDPADNIWKLMVYTSGNSANPADHVITKITVTLPESLSKPYTVELQKGSNIGNDSMQLEYTDTKNDLAVTTTQIDADPDKAAEEPMDKPTYPDDVEKPGEGYKPVEPGENGGIALETKKVSDNQYQIIVTYVGEAFINDGIAAAQINLNLPTDAKIDFTEAITEKGFVYAGGDFDPADNIWKLMVYTSGNSAKPDDHVITVITVTYPEAGYAKDYVVSLQKGSNLGNDSVQLEYSDTKNDMNAVTTVLPANNVLKNEVALSDLIDPAKAAAAAGKDAYIAFEVTKDDGTTPVYGDDYIAYFNGTELTEDQLKALLAGEWADEADYSLENVVKGVTFRYKDGVNIKVQLVVDGEVADSGKTEGEGGKPTPKPQTGTVALTATPASKTYTVGDKVSVKFAYEKRTFTNDAAIALNIPSELLDHAAASGIKISYLGADGKQTTAKKLSDDAFDEGDESVIDITSYPDKGNITIEFTATVKTTKAIELAATLTGKNDKGESAEKKATSKISIKNESTPTTTNGSKDKTTSSGTGIIAGPATGAGAGMGGYFTDMAGYEWANEAVNNLARKNIVAGRGDGTFDPAGQVTRAEYCQMVINAIAKSGDSADTYFNDVPTDAWFYHNVAVAAQLGIVVGYGDGNFGPYDLITREQMALMTQKAAMVVGKSVGGNAGIFADDAEISDWAKAAVYDLAGVGIINGMGDGTFAPKANATRAQAAVIIYQAFVK